MEDETVDNLKVVIFCKPTNKPMRNLDSIRNEIDLENGLRFWRHAIGNSRKETEKLDWAGKNEIGSWTPNGGRRKTGSLEEWIFAIGLVILLGISLALIIK